jgi:hypothetical protein
VLFSVPVYGLARHKKQGAHTPVASQAQGAVHQPVVLSIEATFFEPNAGYLYVLKKMALCKRLLCRRQTQGRDVPTQKFSPLSHLYLQLVFSMTILISDRFQG